MIVLDTKVISELFRSAPDQGVIAWLESLQEDVAITSITLAELLTGVRLLSAGRLADQHARCSDRGDLSGA